MVLSGPSKGDGRMPAGLAVLRSGRPTKTGRAGAPFAGLWQGARREARTPLVEVQVDFRELESVHGDGSAEDGEESSGMHYCC